MNFARYYVITLISHGVCSGHTDVVVRVRIQINCDGKRVGVAWQLISACKVASVGNCYQTASFRSSIDCHG